jgi:predicted metal-dependent enzyme (double-stranded beta helix superfamily)
MVSLYGELLLHVASSYPVGIEEFIADIAGLFTRGSAAEMELVQAIAARLGKVVADGSWLPSELRESSQERYQRHLLYEDPQKRFSIGSFVWAPRQYTPIHDHRSWGVIGALQSGVEAINFSSNLQGGLEETSRGRLAVGETTFVVPQIGDIHRVGNYHDDQVAITIHVYGCAFAEVCKTLYD